MKIAWNILGVLLAVVGTIWFLQGMNVIGGSPMTGKTLWVVNGAIVALVGLGLLAVANRRLSGSSPTGKP
jgi:hypothetical protein